MLTTIGSAIGLFAATNIDDIVVLTVLFLASRRGQLRPWQIVVGQYLGFITLVVISVVAALGLTIIPDEWVGFLGLIPLGIGIWALVRGLRRNGDDDDKIAAVGLWGVAGITIANGADNISLYTPIFRTSSPGDVTIMIVVFLILVAVWCAAGRLIGTHKAVTETLERVEHWLVPVVFIGLGLFILVESGVIIRLIEALA
ncbi:MULTISPECIES: cadmium resistance transporter [Brevibacterium]|uniref:Cadmium transporter n=6 Tax=Brevibacterium TaxID=1696 RepID=A0A144MEG4_BRELN|nr:MULTISPECIES: cadmium resistance transporter [Brevibacterium]MDN5551978.1 cadmium resistance transporter [Brevibacterium sp.]AMT94947.1 cadmium transporter [Brevibacterium linens]MDN5773512.1 cadmium resistance transporter [Brevibacterium aurantiacum]MDN5793165.1 cadmium resistance transporter [Brevibacterium aurantiacum]PCC52689.1 cadmium transporter [Brevibacterium aurantiacum]